MTGSLSLATIHIYVYTYINTQIPGAFSYIFRSTANAGHWNVTEPSLQLANRSPEESSAISGAGPPPPIQKECTKRVRSGSSRTPAVHLQVTGPDAPGEAFQILFELLCGGLGKSAIQECPEAVRVQTCPMLHRPNPNPGTNRLPRKNFCLDPGPERNSC